MARLTKAQILNLTPEQIDIMAKSNPAQLRRITSDLQAITKKRYERQQAKGMKTGFVKGYESAGKTSVRNLSGKELKAEFETQRGFLTEYKTSTMAGSKDVYTEMINKIDPEHQYFAENPNLNSKEDIKRFWDLYHSAKEVAGERIRQGTAGSDIDQELSDIIVNEMDVDSESFDEMLRNVDEARKELYRQRQAGMGYESNPLSKKFE